MAGALSYDEPGEGRWDLTWCKPLDAAPLLERGWEPFAVSTIGTNTLVYLRRRVTEAALRGGRT